MSDPGNAWALSVCISSVDIEDVEPLNVEGGKLSTIVIGCGRKLFTNVGRIEVVVARLLITE